MTKTLTEQCKDGELKDGYYYVVSKWSCKIEINDYYEGCWQDLKEEYIKEVLEPVPSYDEYKRLQEQVKSANNAMKAMLPFAHNYPKERIKKYLNKWGVK